MSEMPKYAIPASMINAILSFAHDVIKDESVPYKSLKCSIIDGSVIVWYRPGECPSDDDEKFVVLDDASWHDDVSAMPESWLEVPLAAFCNMVVSSPCMNDDVTVPETFKATLLRSPYKSDATLRLEDGAWNSVMNCTALSWTHIEFRMFGSDNVTTHLPNKLHRNIALARNDAKFKDNCIVPIDEMTVTEAFKTAMERVRANAPRFKSEDSNTGCNTCMTSCGCAMWTDGRTARFYVPKGLDARAVNKHLPSPFCGQVISFSQGMHDAILSCRTGDVIEGRFIENGRYAAARIQDCSADDTRPARPARHVWWHSCCVYKDGDADGFTQVFHQIFSEIDKDAWVTLTKRDRRELLRWIASTNKTAAGLDKKCLSKADKRAACVGLSLSVTEAQDEGSIALSPVWREDATDDMRKSLSPISFVSHHRGYHDYAETFYYNAKYLETVFKAYKDSIILAFASFGALTVASSDDDGKDLFVVMNMDLSRL